MGETTAKRHGSTTFEDVLEFAEHGDLKALEALDNMANYLGQGISMLVTGLAPEAIVVVGEVTRAWDRVGPSSRIWCGGVRQPMPGRGSRPAARPRSRVCAASSRSFFRSILERPPSDERRDGRNTSTTSIIFDPNLTAGGLDEHDDYGITNEHRRPGFPLTAEWDMAGRRRRSGLSSASPT